MARQIYKATRLYILKIDYDNGKNYILAAKDPDLTELMLKKAIQTGVASPNFYQEYYAVKNNIKTFKITVLQDNVSYKDVRKVVSIYSKTYKSVKLTKEEKDNIIICSAMNKLKDAFIQKNVILNDSQLEFCTTVINTFKNEPKMLKSIADISYKVKTFNEFKNIFNPNDLDITIQ